MKRLKLVLVFRARKLSRSFLGLCAPLVVLATFVAVTLVHAFDHDAQAPVAGPLPSRPFDLVWDSVDGNSLPFGPRWYSQKPGVLPSFKDNCGTAFSGSDVHRVFPGDRDVNYTALAINCTSQEPTVDFPPGPIPCDTPTNNRVLPGHLNWGITTHSGFIFWSEYDDFDGDVNVELLQPAHNAETSLNNGTEFGIHSEFKRFETMGNFAHPWWVDFRKLAFDKTKDAQLHALVDGKRAVITGLLGIDGVHGGYTELHPVFSLAIERQRQSVQDGINETWDFFLRNRGSEGCCSSRTHYWDGLIDPRGGWHWYFIQLPFPPELQGGRVIATVDNRTLQVFANAGFTPPVISQDAQWVYLGFRLPDPSLGPELDGEVTVHFALQSSKPTLIVVRPNVVITKARMIPRGDDWDEVRKHMQPAELRTLDSTMQASQVASVKPQPHAVRLATPVSPPIVQHQPLIGPGHRGQLTRTRTILDPVDAAAREQLNRNLVQIVPKEIVRTKP